MVPEGSVHGPLGPCVGREHNDCGSRWPRRADHSFPGRPKVEKETQEGARIKFNPHGHASGDLLPLTRSHLLPFMYPNNTVMLCIHQGIDAFIRSVPSWSDHLWDCHHTQRCAYSSPRHFLTLSS
jgi:hypothetical protein